MVEFFIFSLLFLRQMRNELLGLSVCEFMYGKLDLIGVIVLSHELTVTSDGWGAGWG